MGAAACKKRWQQPGGEQEASQPYSKIEEGRGAPPGSSAANSRADGPSWVYAVEQRDLQALAQANLKACDSRNAERSAVHACVDAGWADGVGCLLQRRVDPSQADAQGHAALHAAAKLGRKDLLALLLDAGAEVDAQDRDAEGDDTSFRGGSFEKKAEHRTALHYAAEAVSHEACSILLSHRANPNLRDCAYKTPLHLAEDESADKGQLGIVKLLLEQRADPNLGNLQRGARQTSLLAAVYEKNMLMVELLMQSGRCDLSIAGKQGMAALHLAARVRNQPMVELLLAGRADTAQRTDSGKTAADLARANNCLALATLLEGGGGGGGDEGAAAAPGASLLNEVS